MRGLFAGIVVPLLCASVLAVAQTAPPLKEPPPPPGVSKANGKGIITAQGSNEIMANDLLGSPVMSPDGKKVGIVKDLILDPKGTINGLVISAGGIMGLGGKTIGIAASKISFEPAPKNARGEETIVLVRMSAGDLSNAPEFKSFQDIGRSAPAK